MSGEQKRPWCGTVTIRVSGASPERFFRLCAARGIGLWELQCLGKGVYRCSLLRTDFGGLRYVCRKTRTRISIEKKSGLWFLLRAYRKRALFFGAFCGMMLFVFRATMRIWKIEITGNSYLSDELLLSFLEENGIAAGCEKTSLPTDEIEHLLCDSYTQITWSSAYIEGTKLVVDIREQLYSEEEEPDTSGAFDLVAKKNATIVSIVTREGTPCVVAGDEVQSGDVLVSGECVIYDDDGEKMYSIFKRADADVYGCVSYTFCETLPICSTSSVDTGERRKTYYLQLSDMRFGLFATLPTDGYDYIEEITQLCIGDSFYLPIYLGIREYHAGTTGYYTLEQTAAREKGEADFAAFVAELEKNGVSITDKNVMIKKAGNSYEVTGSVYAVEPVAVLSPRKEGKEELSGNEYD